jgi:hypothetical protein
MTWVIGASTLFGSGIVLSDTCVTYSKNGIEVTADAVQKAYAIAPYIVGGFAGSIFIGFEMLTSLSKFLYIPNPKSEYAWELNKVIEDWQPICKEIFAQSPIKEQEAGCHIILVSPHPTENISGSGLARVHIMILKSPGFEPVIVDNGLLTIESIGSGSEAYEKDLEEILENPMPMLKMGTSMKGGSGKVLEFMVTEAMKSNPVAGVSQHMHSFFVRRGEILSSDNSYTTRCQDGTKTEFHMPPVATNYNDLLKILGLEPGKATIIA